jgi:hypothetical protein
LALEGGGGEPVDEQSRAHGRARRVDS